MTLFFGDFSMTMADFKPLKLFSNVLFRFLRLLRLLERRAMLFRACVSRFCSGVARDRDYAGSPRRVSVAEHVELLASTGKLLADPLSLFIVLWIVSMRSK